MDYVSLTDLLVIVPLAILALIFSGSVAVAFASYYEDVEVRPITEDEFSRYLSRPPN